MTWNYKENVSPANASEKVRGLWNVYENERGESSLKIHEPRLVWQSCESNDHFFELTNPGRRECTCKKCQFMTTFIVGLQALVDGKIIDVR